MNGFYKTKDAASKTGIPGKLIRKYSQLLEQHGFEFHTVSNTRCFKLDDLRLLKSIHERTLELNGDLESVIAEILNPQTTPSTMVATSSLSVEDMSETIHQQNKKFEEFMGKLDVLAELNEAIIHQNSTLITQNRQKDDKLDTVMQRVYEREGEQVKLVHELVQHVHRNEYKQEEKLNNLLGHMHRQEERQDERMGKLMNHVYKKEATRDEQLMQLIREMQETKRMMAAATDQSLLKSFRNLFLRFKSEKA